jgi:nicotinate-nucleotide--dimethylbenzimidazole phosphoribosyltransferase
MNWINISPSGYKSVYKENAIDRQFILTKPPGSLGMLEDAAIRLADVQQTDRPSVEKISIAIFAADHGVAEEGVSAFPQEVTGQMVVNFLQGGAAISVLARQLKADLQVIDVGILKSLPQQDGLVIRRAGAGTANMVNEPAMSVEQVEAALEAGRAVVDRITEKHAELFIGGEMGIANTTSAAVLYCALLGLTPEQATGAGTGLDSKGVLHKTNVVRRTLETHKRCSDDVLEWLRCVGGFEIVALVGAYIRASQNRLPILVDGFISSVAALCAARLQPDVNDGLFFSHVSAEQGHRRVLETLNQKPLLDLGMRLGEGSGAAVAATILQSACVLHNQMATFEEAAVADKRYPR